MKGIDTRLAGLFLTLSAAAWAPLPSLAQELDAEGPPPEAEAPPPEAETPELEAATETSAPQTPVASESNALPHAELLLGAGITTRTIHFDAADARRSLDTGMVPALAIELNARVGEQWFCMLRLAYRSSVFAEASQLAPEAATSALTSTIQSHEFVGGFEPGVRFGGEHSVWLGLFAGYGVRALSSVVELTLPRFSLHGPLARLELDIPWLDGRFALRLAPEVQWLVSQTLALRELARTERQGLAFGLEASLRVELLSWLGVQAVYRESRARVASGFPNAFQDIERFVLLNIRIVYN